MDSQAAFDQHVRPRLENTFGKAVTMLILATASNAAGVTMMGLDRSGYERLCEAIARDSRVVDMWGASGASDTLQQWRTLAS